MDSSSIPADQREAIKAIQDFWFPAEWDRDSKPPEGAFKKWYSGGEEVDNFIHDHFGSLYKKLEDKELDAWHNDKDGKLSLILLCDQYSRNHFRGKSCAFGFDPIAIALAKKIRGDEASWSQYKAYEKMFILMPFMHSESREDAELSLKYFTELNESIKDKGISIDGTVKFAVDHKKTIDQFGRYPYRNKVMERETTPEEQEYLKTAATYGQ